MGDSLVFEDILIESAIRFAIFGACEHVDDAVSPGICNGTADGRPEVCPSIPIPRGETRRTSLPLPGNSSPVRTHAPLVEVGGDSPALLEGCAEVVY